MDWAGSGSGSQTVTSVFNAKTNLSQDGYPSPLWDFCISWKGRTDMKLFKSTQKARVGRGHVHPCCCRRFDKQATSPPSWTHPPQHAHKLQKPQLLISKETKMHGFAQVHHRHLHGSASAPSCRSCSHSRRRLHCRPATEMKPRHQEETPGKKSVFRDASCKMTTRHTSLAAAVVVT